MKKERAFPRPLKQGTLSHVCEDMSPTVQAVARKLLELGLVSYGDEYVGCGGILAPALSRARSDDADLSAVVDGGFPPKPLCPSGEAYFDMLAWCWYDPATGEVL